MAGLGIMGQASKPGATLGSSLPGAAAGVKTYMDSSKDIRKTAMEREKMRRLANYQQQNLAAKPYQAMRANMMAAYWKDPKKRALYFEEGATSPEGNTNALFERELIQLAKGPDKTAQDKLTLITARQRWQKEAGALAKKRIRDELKSEGIERTDPRWTKEMEKRMIQAFLKDYNKISGIGALSGDNRPSLSSPVFNKPS